MPLLPDEHLIRLLLVDDHEVVRLGLKTLFEEAGGFQVVGEARRRSIADGNSASGTTAPILAPSTTTATPSTRRTPSKTLAPVNAKVMAEARPVESAVGLNSP